MIPYGNGWVSNPKPVDLTQKNDGAAFWSRFCQFCLRELSSDARSPDRPTNRTPAPRRRARVRSRASGGRRPRANFRLSDDGKNVTVELASSDILKRTTGTLAREGGDADATTLTGDLVLVFHDHATETFTVHATVTLLSADSLEVRLDNYPQWAVNGKFKGTRLQNDIWNRNK